jgi:hypothetical protein
MARLGLGALGFGALAPDGLGAESEVVMGARGVSRWAAAVAAGVVYCAFADGALAVTPGWECVPTAAGQAVVSGGTGSAPSCGAGTTAVLAPTFVSSGVGGKPTVQFDAVNVQLVDGAGSTASVNGTGNLVVGYDENPSNVAQTGSHDLILGRNQSFKGYGELLGGYQNVASGSGATVFGVNNNVSGSYSAVTGGNGNAAKATGASVTGGYMNTAASSDTSVTGGCSNIAGAGTVSLNRTCRDSTGHPNSFAAVAGGLGNQAAKTSSSVAGGDVNSAYDPFSSIAGGCLGVTGTGAPLTTLCEGIGNEAILGGTANQATGASASVLGGYQNQAADLLSVISGGCDNVTGSAAQTFTDCPVASTTQSVLGGYNNVATGHLSVVAGGWDNVASTSKSAILGGKGQTVSSPCQSVPATNTC